MLLGRRGFISVDTKKIGFTRIRSSARKFTTFNPKGRFWARCYVADIRLSSSHSVFVYHIFNVIVSLTSLWAIYEVFYSKRFPSENSVDTYFSFTLTPRYTPNPLLQKVSTYSNSMNHEFLVL